MQTDSGSWDKNDFKSGKVRKETRSKEGERTSKEERVRSSSACLYYYLTSTMMINKAILLLGRGAVACMSDIIQKKRVSISSKSL